MDVFDCCACVWHRVLKMQPSSKTCILRPCFSRHSTALSRVFLNAKTHSVWICPIRKFTAKKKGDTDHAILFLALQFGSFSPDLLPFTLTINSIFMLISELCFWTFLYLYLLKPLFCSLSGRTSKQGVFKVRFAPYTCRADPVVLAIRLKLWRIFKL